MTEINVHIQETPDDVRNSLIRIRAQLKNPDIQVLREEDLKRIEQMIDQLDPAYYGRPLNALPKQHTVKEKYAILLTFYGTGYDFGSSTALNNLWNFMHIFEHLYTAADTRERFLQALNQTNEGSWLEKRYPGIISRTLDLYEDGHVDKLPKQKNEPRLRKV